MSDLSHYQILDDLYKIICARKGCSAKSSYCAKLFKKGRNKIAQKLGEEAVELVIEAVADNKKEAKWELYDMKKDPNELNDLAENNSEKVEQLAQLWQQEEKEHLRKSKL